MCVFVSGFSHTRRLRHRRCRGVVVIESCRGGSALDRRRRRRQPHQPYTANQLKRVQVHRNTDRPTGVVAHNHTLTRRHSLPRLPRQV